MNNEINNNINSKIEFNQQPVQTMYNYNQQMYNKPQVQPKKKSKLLVIIIIILLLATIGGGAYYFLFSGNVNGRKSDDIAKKYINNLIKKKYEENYDLVYIPLESFVNKNDYLDFAQKQEKYENITNKKIISINEQLLTLEDGKYEVVLKDDKEVESKIIVELKKVDSDWKVVEDSFFIKNWAMIIPKNTTLYIDGEKVEEKNIVEDTTIAKTDVKYVISAITSTKKQIKLDNPLQTKELEVTPLYTNNADIYKIELNDEELVNKALTYIKNTWNSIYADYLAGVDVSDVKAKYFDDYVDINMINNIYKNGFDALSDGFSTPVDIFSKYKYINYNIIDIAAFEEKPCYVSTDKVITLNFKYKLTYIWDFLPGDIRTSKRVSSIRLVLDGDSFKIYDVNDEKLFNSNVSDSKVKNWQ